MKRRLFTLAAAVSLVLCIVTLGLWVRSYFVGGYLPLYRGEKRSVFVGSGSGVLVFRHNAIIAPEQAMFRHDFVPRDASEPLTLAVQAGRKGQLAHVVVGPIPFDFCWFVRPRPNSFPRMTLMDGAGGQVTVVGRMDQIDISLWLPAAALAILPLWWYRHWRVEQRQRVLAGLCLHCGYDLRATPQRCPECGNVPATRHTPASSAQV